MMHGPCHMNWRAPLLHHLCTNLSLLNMLFYMHGMEEVVKGRPHLHHALHTKEILDSTVGLQFEMIGLLHNLEVQYEAKYAL